MHSAVYTSKSVMLVVNSPRIADVRREPAGCSTCVPTAADRRVLFRVRKRWEADEGIRVSGSDKGLGRIKRYFIFVSREQDDSIVRVARTVCWAKPSPELFGALGLYQSSQSSYSHPEPRNSTRPSMISRQNTSQVQSNLTNLLAYVCDPRKNTHEAFTCGL
jgi:hypothetical protein